MDSQTVEEREAKKQRNYLGNGKVVWTDGNVCVAEKEVVDESKETSDLPF